METKQKKDSNIKTVTATAIAGSISIAYVTIATVVADLYKPYKTWLANTFSHHWVGKGIISVALFILVTILLLLIPHKATKKCLRNSLLTLFIVSVLGTVIIYAFYLYETFGTH